MAFYAPIAVFTYNRPIHTAKVLNALNESALAPNTDLYIFCDNYKKESDRESVEAVRKIVDEFTESNFFKSATVKKADKNKGLASSIIEGVTQIVNHYGRIIVVEDDMLASKHFLEYMNAGLDYYQNKSNIWSISGYSFPMKALADYPHDVFMSGRGCCWGWSTWVDRWNLVDWDVSDYNAYKHNWIKRYTFAKWGKDLPLMLDSQIYTDHNSWAIRWCYEEFKRNMITVYPKVSYIKNIGNDGTGIHRSSLEQRYDTVLENGQDYQCNFEMLPFDNRIRKDFVAKYYVGWWINFKQQIKWMLIRIGLLKP